MYIIHLSMYGHIVSKMAFIESPPPPHNRILYFIKQKGGGLIYPKTTCTTQSENHMIPRTTGHLHLPKKLSWLHTDRYMCTCTCMHSINSPDICWSSVICLCCCLASSSCCSSSLMLAWIDWLCCWRDEMSPEPEDWPLSPTCMHTHAHSHNTYIHVQGLIPTKIGTMIGTECKVVTNNKATSGWRLWKTNASEIVCEQIWEKG